MSSNKHLNPDLVFNRSRTEIEYQKLNLINDLAILSELTAILRNEEVLGALSRTESR